jgi:tetratricopeptide (TPR) repeat protein
MSQVRTGAVPPLASGYVGRPELDQALAEALVPGGLAALVPVTSVAPGRDWREACGKTQAAVAYAESQWAAGGADVLVWVTATSRAAVLSHLAEAALAVSAAAAASAASAEAAAVGFLDWLRETARPWLVVLDSLADPAVMDGLWPAGPAGRTLVTAASRAVLGPEAGPAGQQATVIQVDMFTPHQSLGYLMGRLTADLDQRQGAVDLATQLGNEPLALAQASAVIASSDLTCRGYLDVLASRRSRVAGGAASSAAALTWAIAVEHAAELAPQIAHPQLVFTALMDGNGVPRATYSESSRQFGVPESVSANGLAALEAAGLLSVDRSVTPALVRMNWVVQAAIRAAAPPDVLAGTAVAAADALLAAWPADDEGDPGRQFRACADRLHQVAGDALWQGGCHGMLRRAGQSLEAAQLAGPTAAYWDGLTAMSEKVLGASHPDTLAIRARLGVARLESGQADEAIAQFHSVASERAQALGPDHPGTARAWQDLGRALLAAGRLEEAVAVLDDAAACYERSTGTDSGESIVAQEDVAAARARAGQPAAAITIYRHTLAVRQRAQGTAHPEAMATCRKLADAYLADGQAKNAITLYKRVLDERGKALGKSHPDTIGARGSLAAAYFAAGRMSQALQLLEQVRNEYTQALGAEHRTTLATSLNLANAYHSIGRLTDAARLLEDTLARCEQNLPDSDSLTIAAREGLAAMTGASSVKPGGI